MKKNKEFERKDICVSSDIEISDDNPHEIIAYLETRFDVDKKFGLNINDEDGTWLNMYAFFNPFEDTLRIQCIISRDDSEETFDYTTTQTESEIIKDLIEETLCQYHAQTPKGFCLGIKDKYEKMHTEFYKTIKESVIDNGDMRKLHFAYKNQDISYLTNILCQMHEIYFKMFGNDEIPSDMGFVSIPSVVLGSNNKIFLAITEFENFYSGEHWNTHFITPYGIYSHMSNNTNPVTKNYVEGVFPHQYWCTDEYNENDRTPCPKEISDMINKARAQVGQGEICTKEVNFGLTMGGM